MRTREKHRPLTPAILEANPGDMISEGVLQKQVVDSQGRRVGGAGCAQRIATGRADEDWLEK